MLVPLELKPVGFVLSAEWVLKTGWYGQADFGSSRLCFLLIFTRFYFDELHWMPELNGLSQKRRYDRIAHLLERSKKKNPYPH